MLNHLFQDHLDPLDPQVLMANRVVQDLVALMEVLDLLAQEVQLDPEDLPESQDQSDLEDH